MAGVRSSKTVGSTTYKYDTLSGKVMRQSWGSNVIDFVYDENNQPYAMRYNGTVYYYMLNVQGDVVGLLNSSGAIAAKYTYDPWGKVTVQNPSGTTNTSSSFIGNINPLRYRGYYYDTETGFYYLQTRYYDPAICRFINADTYATTDAEGLLSTNMFAYCENNPVMGTDPTGEFLDTVFDVISLCSSVAEVIANPANPWAWAGLAGDVVDLIPGVTGVGETVRTVKAAKTLRSNGKRIINNKYAGKVFELKGELANKYGKGVKFNKYGFPDFSEFAKESVVVKGLSGNRYHDFKLANKQAGLKSTPKGFTWHHVQDGRTMQLIPTDLHRAVRHTGGVSVLKLK